MGKLTGIPGIVQYRRISEESKLEFTITVNWWRQDGSIATTQLGTLDRGACRSAEDVGLQLADAKPILGRLQEIVVREQLQQYAWVTARVDVNRHGIYLWSNGLREFFFCP
jgi:hypothetical protein